MNQKTNTANATIASSVPIPTERMLMTPDMCASPSPCPQEYDGCLLLEQRLPGELDGGVELVVDVGLLREAVALVLRENEPHGRAALFQRRDDLLGLGVGHARVVQALHDHHGLADLLRV